MFQGGWQRREAQNEMRRSSGWPVGMWWQRVLCGWSSTRIRRKSPGLPRWAGAVVLWGALCAAAAPAAPAATVALGEASAIPGQAQVALPLSVAIPAGEQVSALAVDIQFDTALTTWGSVVLEPGAAALGKQVAANVLAPGRVRLVLYGVDRQALSSGVVGNCLVSVPASAGIGTAVFTLQGALGADPDGRELTLTAVDGRLWIDGAPDTQAPRISNVDVSGVTATGATITWQTDEPTRSTIALGTTTAYELFSLAGETDASLAHQAVITGLTPAQLLHFTIEATDAAGNRTQTNDQTFSTLALPDTTAPTLSVNSPVESAVFALGDLVAVSGVALDNRQSTLTVKVNGAAATLGADGRFTKALSGLAAGTQLITVQATDAAGNRVEVRRSITVEAVSDLPWVKILKPTVGSTVTGPSVTLEVAVGNVEIRGGTGYTHMHIRLDSGVIWHVANIKPFVIANVKRGTHTLSVMLADNATHTRVPGSELQRVTFTVQ